MRKEQIGRSMIEMLAVLAIIAVLSISSLMGYRYALNKNKANNILYDVKTLAVLSISDDIFAHKENGEKIPSTHLGFLSESGSKFAIVKETDMTFYIEAFPIAQKICNYLLKVENPLIEEVTANEGMGCQPGEENILQFYLNNDLREEMSNPNRFARCETTSDCPGTCAECRNKICYDNSRLCGGDTPYCVSGNCVKCPKGEIQQGYECIPCSESAIIYDEEGKKCAGCSDRFYASGHKQCVLCSTQVGYASTKEECLKCPDRYYAGDKCYYCEGTVTNDGTACSWNCPQGQFGSASNCYDCNEPQEVFWGSNAQTCSQCFNRFYSPNNRTCVLCSIQQGWNTTEEECLRCPNRYYIANTCYPCTGTVIDNGTACLWDCPEGQFGSGAECYDCTDSREIVWTTNAETCSQCSNRFYSPNDRTCVLCSIQQGWNTTEEECLRCPNRYYIANTCYPCTGTVIDNGTACLWDCPEGQFGSGSECYDCTDSREIVWTTNAKTCSQCSNRFYSSNDRTCVLCSSQATYACAKEDCLKCSNRYYVNGLCRYCNGTVTSDGTGCE